MFAPTQLTYQTPFSTNHVAPQHSERIDKVYRVALHSANGTVYGVNDGGAKWNDPLDFNVNLEDVMLNISKYQLAVEYFTLAFDDTSTGQTTIPFAIKIDGMSLPNSYDTKTNNRNNVVLCGSFGDGQSMILNTITPDTFGFPCGNLDLRKLKVQIIKATDYTALAESHFGVGHGSWMLGLIFYPIK